MAFWNKKKVDSRFISYFIDKKIPYEVENNEVIRIKFEMCLKEKQLMIYPYLTIDDHTISLNVNLVEHSLKGYNFERLNEFNLQSKFFKAYITDTGIVVLEYRFMQGDDCSILDELLQNLVNLQNEIDVL